MKEKLKKIITVLVVLCVILLGTSAVINIYQHRHEDFKNRQGVVEVSAEPEINVTEIVDPMIENTIEAPEVYINKFTTTGLNIRKGPGIEYEIIKTVDINTELQMLEGSNTNNWVIIKLGNDKYYVNSNYLSDEKTVIKSKPVTTRSAATGSKAVRTPVKEQQSTAAADNCVGYYTLTYYCSCSKCCGKTNGVTAWGTKATPGRTIAASSKFAFGTKLIINGHEYIVEDRGGAIQGNKIDVYVGSHSEAIKLGVQRNVPVYRSK